MWKEWEMKKWQSEQMPKQWRGNGGEEDRNSDWVCVKSDLEIMGEE